MTHRKWDREVWQSTCYDNFFNEHNALYDAWVVERDRADELLKDRNLIQHKLDEARKRIAELESPLRVLFSDDVIERMAKAHMGVISPCANWEHADKQYYMNAIRAALAAGGIEPCAVPEYDPADVALRPADAADSTPIIADLHKQLEAARREVDEVRRHISVTMSREHQARKDAQEAKRESHDLRAELAREMEWTKQYKQDRDDALAELATLRERAAVPVKVRWDVTPEDAAKMMQHIKTGIRDAYSAWDDLGENYKEDAINAFGKLLPRLAAHAVIDVPAGVPGVEELDTIANDAWEDAAAKTANNRERQHAMLSAIRDAVLAGVGVAHYKYCNGNGGWVVAEYESGGAFVGQHFDSCPKCKETGVLPSTDDAHLRDPVGKPELDVTAEELYAIWHDGDRDVLSVMQAILDICRSRIRPVMECKECADNKRLADAAIISERVATERLAAARAALEGE